MNKNNNQESNFPSFNEMFNMFLRLALVFVFFTCSFTALSVSLQCNQDKSIFMKMAIGFYAFIFSPVYLFVNYYSYRLISQKNPCSINPDNLFPL